MRKITFITLMMILGMSSVSFGNEKSYLCEPTTGIFLGRSYIIQPSQQLSRVRFLVKTENNDSQMVSVKQINYNLFVCKVGEVIISGEYNTVRSGIGESLKGEYVLTCRQPHTEESGGYTQTEFNLNLTNMFFNFYTMNINQVRTGMIHNGKCEEIK